MGIEMSKRVAVIGLGSMGLGMAQSLLRAGFEVHAFDVRPAVMASFVQQGGHATQSPADAASKANVVVSVVVNAAQTESVLFADKGVMQGMQAGSVFVMCSTVAPEYSIGLEKKLQQQGMLYLDAPISGGAAKAASGEITMMTSGSAQAYAIVDPFLDAMAAKVYRLGAQAGLGSKVKIVNQLLAGVHIAAAAEAMALGIREGLDPAAIYEVITHSAGNSWMFENRMPHVLDDDYTPRSAVDIFVKDLGLVLDTAEASKFPLPLTATARQMYMQASSSGYGGQDDAAVIKIFPGITLPSKKA
jgi:L-threonate 2-dehydrogenase